MDETEDESDWSSDEQEVIELFSGKICSSIKEAFAYSLENYAFDFFGFVSKHNLDEYQSIKTINFIREQIQQDINPELLVLKLLPSLNYLQNDKYFKPVIENDSLLFAFEYENKIETEKNEMKNSKLIFKIDDCLKFLEQPSTCLPDQHAQILQMQKTLNTILSSTEDCKSDTSEYYEDSYFKSYNRVSIHRTMLRDRKRTLAYYDFIGNNKDIFHNKTVMDIGCGTGVLSIFALKAGAKHVIAIDNSDIILRKTKFILENNNLKNITLIKSKVEDIHSLSNYLSKNEMKEELKEELNDGNVCKVDIIISEWMGYFLLFESMMSTIIYARDKYLNISTVNTFDGNYNGRNGNPNDALNCIFPNKARMFMAGMDYDSMCKYFWKYECYDIDMSVMYDRPRMISQPIITMVDPLFINTQFTCFQVCTLLCSLFFIDCCTLMFRNLI